MYVINYVYKLTTKTYNSHEESDQTEVKRSIECELISAFIKKMETSGMSTVQIEQGRQEGETCLGASKFS